MEDFKIIYEGNIADHLICKHCDSRVELGIINVSNHFISCDKNTEGLIISKDKEVSKILDRLSINV